MEGILRKIAEVAMLAGIRGSLDSENGRFVAGFQMEDGRSQEVWVNPTIRLASGAQVVTFSSPCYQYSKGFLKGMSKGDAIDLLRRNEKTAFARYGLITLKDGSDIVMASADQILDTLDAAEFHAHIWAVATAADSLEKEKGVDRF